MGMRKGAYAPFTLSGDILVSGVVASNYVSIIPDEEIGLPVTMQFIAHMFTAPHRIVCSVRFSFCEKETYINGLSRWIYTPYYVSKWLAKQNDYVKTAGIAILITLMFGAPFLCSALILRMIRNTQKKGSNHIVCGRINTVKPYHVQ